MSRIKGKNTTPERAVRSMLWRQGFRFRLHAKGLPGRPDIVLPKWRAVVLVNGCFWHWHENCSLFRLPSTRVDFWRQKLDANRQRDARTLRALELAGWRIAVVWECALREAPEAVQMKLANWIRGGAPSIQFGGCRGQLIEGALPP